MKKDVLLSISGLQFVSKDEEDAEQVEVITAGDYYKKNGKHYVLYDEVMEGFTGNTRNIIKLTEDSLDITKKGVSNVHMVFEKNKKNVSYYNTPFGSLLIGIDAKNIDIAETEDNIDVKVKYNLEVNYEHLADCFITMSIKSKEAGNFTLA
ncbi:DUF1934 domain-containing protein [Lachnospiraceae bacterium 29-84]